MQYFLHGFQGKLQYCLVIGIRFYVPTDASDFLRKHPLPGRAIADTFDDSTHRQGGFSKRFLNTVKIVCGRTGDTDDVYDDADYEDERVLFDATEASGPQQHFYWSQLLQQSFREELEK